MNEQNDYAKRLAEIEARHEVTDAHPYDKHTKAHADRAWLLSQLRAASEALAALGVPDDGRPLAERVGDVGRVLRITDGQARDRQAERAHDAMAKASAVHDLDILKRAVRAALVTMGEVVPDDAGPETLAAALRRGAEDGEAAWQDVKDDRERLKAQIESLLMESAVHSSADARIHSLAFGAVLDVLDGKPTPVTERIKDCERRWSERLAKEREKGREEERGRLLSLRVDLRDEAACAEITPEQANAYLKGKGWEHARDGRMSAVWQHDAAHRAAMVPHERGDYYGRRLAEVIRECADVEKRSPLAVWAEMKTASQ